MSANNLLELNFLIDAKSNQNLVLLPLPPFSRFLTFKLEIFTFALIRSFLERLEREADDGRPFIFSLAALYLPTDFTRLPSSFCSFPNPFPDAPYAPTSDASDALLRLLPDYF